MALRRTLAYIGAGLLGTFVLVVLLYGQYAGGNWIIVALVLVLLIVAGSRLYGRQSRYGAIAASKRPAQDAHDRAADLAADARRAVAEAAKKGERYCPLDPAVHTDSVATNGHASAAHPAPSPPPPSAPPSAT